MVTYASLQVDQSTAWHSGDKTIFYSYLTNRIPDYYDQRNIPQEHGGDDTSASDAWVLGTNDANQDYIIPIGHNASLSATQKAAAEAAVRIWNEIANINLVEGTAGSASGSVPVEGDGRLVSGLGGPAGFGEHQNTSSAFRSYGPDLVKSVFENGLNFYGTVYEFLNVNNGAVGFGRYFEQFVSSPEQRGPISDSERPGIVAFLSTLGTARTDTGTRADRVYADFDTVNDVITFTWSDVGYLESNPRTGPPAVTNSFQIQLYDRGNGDFDFVFRYEDINWNARLGYIDDPTPDGLSLDAARIGWSAGDKTNYFEIPGSGDPDAVLKLEDTLGNTGVKGLYVFQVRNGRVVENAEAAAFGDILFGTYSGRSTDGTNAGAPTLGTAGIPNNDVGGFTGYPNSPGNFGDGGDIWINNVYGTNPTPGTYPWKVLVHELGHALGLSHPDDDPGNINLPNNSEQYTIMSYVPHPNQDATTGNQPSDQMDFVFPITPMLFDMQAIQNMYGANMSTRTENNTYFGPGANRVYAFGDQEATILCVWDAGGIDTFDASNQTKQVIIDLNPGAYSTIGKIRDNVVIASGTMADGTDIPRAESAWIENAVGGSGDDVLSGNKLDNTLTGGRGIDTIDGREGTDTAVYSGKYETYSVRKKADGSVDVQANATDEEFDMLMNVERLQFADGELAFDVDGNAGQVFRLYQAALDRKPDPAGLTFWVRNTDAGAVNLNTLASAFLVSDEFQATYGTAETVSNNQYVNLLYNNVLDREADGEGLQFWDGQFASGFTRESMLISFSESAENQANVADLVKDGIWLA